MFLKTSSDHKPFQRQTVEPPSSKSINMFGLFKSDPIKKLEKEYAQLMEEAMHIQRSGDLKAYAAKIEASEAILQQIEALKQK